MLRGSPSQLAARTASHAVDLTSYRLSCAATLAVVFRERDAHRKRIAEGGERSATLSKQYAEDRQWICLFDFCILTCRVFCGVFPHYPIYAHRLSDVLDFSFAEILIAQRYLILDLIVHRA